MIFAVISLPGAQIIAAGKTLAKKFRLRFTDLSDSGKVTWGEDQSTLISQARQFFDSPQEDSVYCLPSALADSEDFPELAAHFRAAGGTLVYLQMPTAEWAKVGGIGVANPLGLGMVRAAYRMLGTKRQETILAAGAISIPHEAIVANQKGWWDLLNSE